MELADAQEEILSYKRTSNEEYVNFNHFGAHRSRGVQACYKTSVMLVGLLCVVLLIVNTGLLIKTRADRQDQYYKMSMQHFTPQRSYNFTVEDRDNLQLRLCKLEMEIKENAVDITLDLDTANHFLIVSDDRKQVKTTTNRQDHPDHPKRFEIYHLVHGKQGFSSGRFYYEVQVKGKTMWYLGVVRETTKRKEKVSSNSEHGIWAIRLRNGTYEGLTDDGLVPFKPMQRLDRVGVFVDIGAKMLSFYNAGYWDLLFSFKRVQFNGTVYPLFSPEPLDGGRNTAPLVITNPVDCMSSLNA